jgi:hypothetical protein
MVEHIQSYRRNTGLAATLRVLADDLDRISAGAGPTEADLARAPILFDWEPKLNSAHEPAIRGAVRGHPAIPDGEFLRAEILAVALQLPAPIREKDFPHVASIIRCPSKLRFLTLRAATCSQSEWG